MPKYDLDQKVTVKKGPFKNETGRVVGYETGKYQVRFAGRGRCAVTCDFRSTELKPKN